MASAASSTSASTKNRTSPRADSAARLRAIAGPERVPVLTIVTPGRSSHAGTGGGEPSNTKTTSAFAVVSSSSDNTRRAHRSNVPVQKIVGMITEISNSRVPEAASLLRGDSTTDGCGRRLFTVVGMCESCMRCDSCERQSPGNPFPGAAVRPTRTTINQHFKMSTKNDVSPQQRARTGKCAHEMAIARSFWQPNPRERRVSCCRPGPGQRPRNRRAKSSSFDPETTRASSSVRE